MTSINALFRRAAALLIAAALLASPAPLHADEATDAWNEVATWIQKNRPRPATKSAMASYRRNVARRLETFLESYPDYRGRVGVQKLLGETYLNMPSYPKAMALFESMVEAEGDSGPVGRVGVLRTLCAQRKLVTARNKLDGYLLAHPDEESLHEFDAFLKEQQKKGDRKKAFKKLKRRSPFPDFSGKVLDGEGRWELSRNKGKVTLLGFWMSHDGRGKVIKTGSKELAIVKELYADYKEAGLVVLGIPLDRDLDLLRGFVKKHGISWPQLENGLEVAGDLGVATLPMWVLLDPAGRIIAKDLRTIKLPREVKKAMKKHGS